jgi:CheY-like chemotaxis protein
MSIRRLVFVVDDSTITRLFIIDAIKDIEGIEIQQFVNGEHLINKLNEQIPDLILLDLVMPVMDGLTVLENLRGKGINIPVIICTADIQATTRTKALNLGATNFINKPIQKPVLLETVTKVLQS